MKSGIHPAYVETTVVCGCGNTLHHPQHQGERPHRGRGLLAVPPVLHRQAEDPRQRRPRRPLREALRQAHQATPRRLPTSSCLTDARSVAIQRQAGRRFAFRARVDREEDDDGHERHGDRRRCSPSTPTSRRQLVRSRRCTPTPAPPAGSAAGSRSWRRSSRPTASSKPPAATWRPPANWPPRTRRSPPRCPSSKPRVAELDTQLTDLLAPRDPHDADDIVLEVKSGEGGEESALFAADLARMYIRYAERHGWTVTVLDETTSDLGGYKDATLSDRQQGRLRRRRVVAAEVRGRRAPRAARAGHRIAGPRAHLGGRRAGLPGARGGRGRSRSTNPICASTSTGRRARAVRASTPPTPRSASPTCPPASSSPARTSARQLQNKARAMHGARRPAAGARRGAGVGRRVGRPGQPDPHRRPQRADPHLQLPGEPDRRSPDQLQGAQPRPGARR